MAKALQYSEAPQRIGLPPTRTGGGRAMASSFGYASASGPGCRDRGTNIAGGTIKGGSSTATALDT